MENIIDKHLIPDIRSIVMSYVDDYKQQYEFVLWQLRILHRDSLFFVSKTLSFTNFNFKYFYQSGRYPYPYWTHARRDYYLMEISCQRLPNSLLNSLRNLR